MHMSGSIGKDREGEGMDSRLCGEDLTSSQLREYLPHTTIDPRELDIPSALPYASFRGGVRCL